MAQQLARLYLPAAFFVAFAPLAVRPAAGLGAAIAVVVANLALVAVMIWLIGARRDETGDAPAARLPGTLLTTGPLALLALAALTGEPKASRPAEFLINTTGLLLGAIILFVGFALLAARLWAAGEWTLATLGFAGLLIGNALWLTNLIARYAVVASGAAGLQAAIEGEYWVADHYLLGLPGEPSWLGYLLVWLDMLQLAYAIVAFLCAAVAWAAAARVGWVGRHGARIGAALGLILALVVVGGIILAAPGSAVAAGVAYILTAPFTATILPYFLGVALLRRAAPVGATDRARPVPAPAGVPG